MPEELSLEKESEVPVPRPHREAAQGSSTAAVGCTDRGQAAWVQIPLMPHSSYGYTAKLLTSLCHNAFIFQMEVTSVTVVISRGSCEDSTNKHL